MTNTTNRKVHRLSHLIGIMLLTLAVSVEAQTTDLILGQETTKKDFECPKIRTSHPCGATLNHLTVSRPDPEYPEEAKASGAAGSVTVCVQVDETGKVYSAGACKGHPLLRQAATAAAYRARLRPFYVAGKPIKHTGALIYSFTKPTANR